MYKSNPQLSNPTLINDNLYNALRRFATNPEAKDVITSIHLDSSREDSPQTFKLLKDATERTIQSIWNDESPDSFNKGKKSDALINAFQEAFQSLPDNMTRLTLSDFTVENVSFSFSNTNLENVTFESIEIMNHDVFKGTSFKGCDFCESVVYNPEALALSNFEGGEGELALHQANQTGIYDDLITEGITSDMSPDQRQSIQCSFIDKARDQMQIQEKLEFKSENALQMVKELEHKLENKSQTVERLESKLAQATEREKGLEHKLAQVSQEVEELKYKSSSTDERLRQPVDSTHAVAQASSSKGLLPKRESSQPMTIDQLKKQRKRSREDSAKRISQLSGEVNAMGESKQKMAVAFASSEAAGVPNTKQKKAEHSSHARP